jgi:hypothetical protein
MTRLQSTGRDEQRSDGNADVAYQARQRWRRRRHGREITQAGQDTAPAPRLSKPSKEYAPVSDDHLFEYWPGDTSPSVVAALRQEFPGYRISRELFVGQVQYIACRLHPGAHPHSVITADPGKLRAALKDGQHE